MTEAEIPFLSDEELDILYYTVRSGFDDHAALEIIKFFGEALKPDGQVPLSDRAVEILHKWMGQVFRTISEGRNGDANVALGLKRQPGRPKQIRDKEARDLILAAKVLHRMEELRVEGIASPYQTAIGDVVNEVFSSDEGDSVVRSAYNEYKASLIDQRSIAPEEFNALVDTVLDLDEFKVD